MKKKNKKSISEKISNTRLIKNIKKLTSKIDLSKNKFNTLELILIFIMALVFGLLIGEAIFQTGGKQISLTEKTRINEVEIEEVYKTILEEYINEINEEDLKEAAIGGMLSLLGDRHTGYYNEETSQDLKDELNGYFYGIGAVVYQEKGKLVTINEVYKDTPAEKAGLKKGDQYLKINGKDITKQASEEIAKQIKGSNGKKINLTILRAGEEITTSLTTSKIEIPSVTKEILTKDKEKIGYLGLSIFATNTDEQLQKALTELDKENINKIILDLRYNQGGELETVVNIASMFLPNKTPIIKIDKEGKIKTRYSKAKENKQYEIVVLINGASASGSEVLAAALNEQLNSKLIGERTYGKGTVQKTKNLPTGGVFKYTIETWQTSKGKSIEEKGITPTIEVKQNKNYFKKGERKYDTQLQKAIEVILEK